jgi:hypothetical protein
MTPPAFLLALFYNSTSLADGPITLCVTLSERAAATELAPERQVRQFSARSWAGFCSIRDPAHCRIAVPCEQRMDNFSRGRENLAGLPKVTQMVSLNFEQAGFHSRSAAQPPQHTG